MKRLMKVKRPAHLHSPTLFVLTIVPMKPSNAKAIPIEEMIWISNIKFLFSPRTKSKKKIIKIHKTNIIISIYFVLLINKFLSSDSGNS